MNMTTVFDHRLQDAVKKLQFVTKPIFWSSNDVMATNSQKELIEKIIGGDTRAFAEVVELHKNLVYSVALRMLKNDVEAEEVSQDTFVKVYTSLRSFKGGSKFSTWIYRIAYNTCLDRLKKNQRRIEQQNLDVILDTEVDNLNNALEDMLLEERNQMIHSCLDLLPEEDAALLTFFYFEEMNLKEIQKVMGLTVNTLKVRLFRARKRLAKVMVDCLETEILKNYG